MMEVLFAINKCYTVKCVVEEIIYTYLKNHWTHLLSPVIIQSTKIYINYKNVCGARR